VESAQQLPLEALEVGLFPLPNVVLFPGILLPLMVFEPRYRALTAEALGTTRLIAVPRLRPGHEQDYFGAPPLFDVCGVGRIVQHEKLEDGRYKLLLQGQYRAKLAQETQVEPYRIARIDPVRESEPMNAPAVLSLRSELLRIVTAVAPRVATPADKLIEGVRDAETAAKAADLVAATLVEDPDTRQRLLEEVAPSKRMELLITELHGARARLEPGSRSRLTLN
jgi:uncharacterized protein